MAWQTIDVSFLSCLSFLAPAKIPSIVRYACFWHSVFYLFIQHNRLGLHCAIKGLLFLVPSPTTLLQRCCLKLPNPCWILNEILDSRDNISKSLCRGAEMTLSRLQKLRGEQGCLGKQLECFQRLDYMLDQITNGQLMQQALLPCLKEHQLRCRIERISFSRDACSRDVISTQQPGYTKL